MVSKEMQKALEADGEKLRQLTGKDHGPRFFMHDEEIDLTDIPEAGEEFFKEAKLVLPKEEAVITIADVLVEVRGQLDWQGPNGKRMGHIVLTYEQAKYWHEHSLTIMLERDQLVYERDHPKKNDLPKNLGGSLAESAD